jgi:acyl carrier protein/GNAT superfamily N-acetyltransferase
VSSTPRAIEERLLQIIRTEVLVGSDRELPPDIPLGELGLDSLALVTFLTRVEASFGIALPDDVWIAREPLSIAGVAELVAAAAPVEEPSAAPPAPAPAGPRLDRSERVEGLLARAGMAGRALWRVVLAGVRLRHFLFERSANVVLERALEGDLPGADTEDGVVLRTYEPSDDPGLSGLWQPYEEERQRHRLAAALRDGVVALVAARNGRVVALDLLSSRGEEDIRLERPQACYGYRLVEAPDARGHGIGVALLAHSLRAAQELGFRSQITVVEDHNRAMLATATLILGFRQIGTARRLRILGRTRWSWEVDGRRGSGPSLVV